MRFSKELARRQGGNGYTKGILRVYKCSKDLRALCISLSRYEKDYFDPE